MMLAGDIHWLKKQSKLFSVCQYNQISQKYEQSLLFNQAWLFVYLFSCNPCSIGCVCYPSASTSYVPRSKGLFVDTNFCSHQVAHWACFADSPLWEILSFGLYQHLSASPQGTKRIHAKVTGSFSDNTCPPPQVKVSSKCT